MKKIPDVMQSMMTHKAKAHSPPDSITPYQLDALSEFLCVGVGKAASAINTMLGRHIDLNVPTISLLNSSDACFDQYNDGIQYSIVTLGFHGNISGTASIIFDPQGAKDLINTLTPGLSVNEVEVNEMTESIVCEIGNIFVNEVMGTLANISESTLTYQVPRYSESTVTELYKIHSKLNNNQVILTEDFTIKDNSPINGKLLIFHVLDDIKNLLNTLGVPPHAIKFINSYKRYDRHIETHLNQHTKAT